jgi:HNH endonuclease
VSYVRRPDCSSKDCGLTWRYKKGVHYLVEDRGYVTPCWIWRSTSQKYPRSRADARPYRDSYETFIGSIPEGMEIHHLCGQTHCVNPKHLEAVTRAEHNQRSKAILTVAQVREIRERAAQGETLRSLAREFGVSHTTVIEINRRKAWRNI